MKLADQGFAEGFAVLVEEPSLENGGAADFGLDRFQDFRGIERRLGVGHLQTLLVLKQVMNRCVRNGREERPVQLPVVFIDRTEEFLAAGIHPIAQRTNVGAHFDLQSRGDPVELVLTAGKTTDKLGIGIRAFRVIRHLIADRSPVAQDPEGDIAIVLPQHHFRAEHALPCVLHLLAIGTPVIQPVQRVADPRPPGDLDHGPAAFQGVVRLAMLVLAILAGDIPDRADDILIIAVAFPCHSPFAILLNDRVHFAHVPGKQFALVLEVVASQKLLILGSHRGFITADVEIGGTLEDGGDLLHHDIERLIHLRERNIHPRPFAKDLR